MIDYLVLLKKYMDLVAEHEGTTFVDFCGTNFTKDEKQKLKEMDQNIF